MQKEFHGVASGTGKSRRWRDGDWRFAGGTGCERTVRRVVLLPVCLALLGIATAHATPPYSLDGLIARTIRHHPGIAARHAEVKATQAEVDAARAQYFPTPSVQLLQDKGESTTVLTLQQPLWAGGRLDAGLDAAQSRENATRVSVNDTQYTLALRVTAAWAAWVQARGRGEALDKGVALLNVYAESVSRRIQGGASGQVDRELVAARLAQTQGDLAAARSAERSALARLAQMIGQPLRAQDLVVADAVAGVDIPLPGLDALVAQAFARSAALKRLESDIETARHETQQRRAALWPTLSLRAQHQRGNAPATGITANDSRVMLVLEYTPGAGLSAGANIDAAEARIIGLRENLDAARRDLTETITTDYEEHLAGSDRKRHFQRTLKASAEVLASYDRLFVAGKRNWLDVINAARELIQAQTALADVEAQLVAARARLRLHIGEML
ncbi:TolC family protein [Sulfuritalea hydrogenivorans]|uniref:Outer membrane efflux protein n=1 Tax=Sulfuritalea hydrogenivorans sk43H TaxID=1223802 RepID=W0SHA0_9PROT|nr:TolC family protein [Sulfuritalea hydrogenivorans]BAO30160.1 outer membrane efflux protein [Sulfuritalea hydrogenivorans sk43H]